MQSEARIDNCTITYNECYANGGGIFTCGEDSNAVSVITNCVIANNIGNYSGAMSSFDYNSFVKIENCTITNNEGACRYVNEGAEYQIGGLECWDGRASITNSIIWGNIGVSIDTGDINDVNDVVVTYSDIQMFDSNGFSDPCAIWDGEGNINEDPLFADPDIWVSDYHLKSSSGRWDPEDLDNQ
ncbi:unnamed protein product, partial [marine sediment metagenome]